MKGVLAASCCLHVHCWSLDGGQVLRQGRVSAWCMPVALLLFVAVCSSTYTLSVLQHSQKKSKRQEVFCAYTAQLLSVTLPINVAHTACAFLVGRLSCPQVSFRRVVCCSFPLFVCVPADLLHLNSSCLQRHVAFLFETGQDIGCCSLHC
jgi:hypothetical protein